MNANQLLEAMRNGAKLTVRWKPRSGAMRPKLLYRLTLPDGTVISTQASAVAPLIRRGLVQAITWSGGARDYHLAEAMKQESI